MILIRVVILGGVFFIFAVNVVQLAWTERDSRLISASLSLYLSSRDCQFHFCRPEAVEDIGDLVSYGRVAADGANGVHVRSRLPPVPDQVVQRQVLHRRRLRELRGKDRVGDGQGVALTSCDWTLC